MLAEGKLRSLNEFIDKLSRDEIIWVNGYLSGKLLLTGSSSPLTSSTEVIQKKFTILYGTDTGNSKKLSIEFSAIAKKDGAKTKLANMNTYNIEDLKNETNLCIIMSTHGDGDPPPSAKKFFDALMQTDLPLQKIEFALLALGDSSYPYFCKAGDDVFHRLTSLGATASIPVQKCDVDYQNDANYWYQNYLKTLKSETAKSVADGSFKKIPSGKKYYHGIVKANINLNGKGSKKQTNHIEIQTNEQIIYEAGDALGIMPRNKPETLTRIFENVKIDSSLSVPYKGSSHTLSSLFIHKLNICYLKESQVQKYAEITDQKIPIVRMDLVDLVRIFPAKPIQFLEFLPYLNEIAPRLYSVCSSPLTREKEIHILVSKNTFHIQEEKRYGLCSDMLCDFDEGIELDFYIYKNKSFRLPPEDTDVILIGPGTGIAPMRSFMEERDASGASGKNWLFFGEQHFTTDFFYQSEIQEFYTTGALHKVDLAWSRDQDKKCYVQDRMIQNGKELYEWIKNGAHIFVSGSRTPMSEDVEKAIVDIIYAHSGKSAPESEEYWNELKEAGIYKADVY